MGLDYSYEVFLPARGVAGALAGLPALAPPRRDVPPLAVTLPGRGRVDLPYTSWFKSDPVDCSAGGDLRLDLSVLCGPDPAVDAYAAESHLEPVGPGRFDIGYVYLTVRFAPALHPRHASLQFTAATSRMSRLFEESAGIREAFTGFTAAVGGVCCLLDTESETSRVRWLDGGPADETVPGPRFPGYRELVAAWPG
ncbi:hypothetical protein ACIPW5_18960 [Streptomyces sp. NPDC090077]|uniref:hypothetical protein n=1 Tax=Streptomyces sp. NPDC090077 TaxID=3365938 RepID=UPI003825B09B